MLFIISSFNFKINMVMFHVKYYTNKFIIRSINLTIEINEKFDDIFLRFIEIIMIYS